MKFLCLLLCVSLLCNGVLLRLSVSDTQPASTPKKVQAPAFVLNDTIWQKATSGDPTSLQAIRDAGFSPEQTRALLSAAISEMFKAKMDALYPSKNDIKYWKNNYNNIFYGPQNRTAALDLRREENAVRDKWLPKLGSDQPDLAANSYISTGKQRQLSAIEQDYQAMIADVRTAIGQGAQQVVLPADKEKLAYLQREEAKELAELLTPKELEEYNARSSSTANSLRYELGPFEPTENEFREIVKIKKQLVDDPFPAVMNSMTPEERAARTEAQKAADAQIKAALGDQRYADYVRAKDYDYRAFAEITRRLALPKDRAIEAYQLKTDLEQQYRATNSTSQADQAQAVATLCQTADREFTRILGDKGYAVYKQYGMLPRMAQSLLRRPTPPPPPKG